MSQDDDLSPWDRIEPNVGSPNASICISLKRIADVLERVEALLTPQAIYKIAQEVRAIAEAEDATSNQDFKR